MLFSLQNIIKAYYMLVFNYIALFIILIVLVLLYERFLEKSSKYINSDDYEGMRKYLLSDSKPSQSKNPIIWVYIPYEYNSRNWASFGSRSSVELNQPYLYLTVKSIIKYCDKSFNICLIDDDVFGKLLPNWNINMKLLSEPLKGYIRQLAMAQLIYAYGGMSVPISFLCLKDLKPLYVKGTNNDTMFVCENYDTNVTSATDLFYPNANFMGAPKNNQTMEKYIDFMQRIISGDYTAQTNFIGDFDRWCNGQINHNNMRLISGTDIGTKTINDETVIVDTLLSDNYIDFYDKMYGIWIPGDAILHRNHYEWFARLSHEQIFESKFILAKYFVLALAPNNDGKQQTVEPMKNVSNGWIDFWRVPLTNGTLNVFGPKPIFLGNDIPNAKNSGNMN